MAGATGEGYAKLSVQNLSLWQSINHDSAVNSINIAQKRGIYFGLKANILD